ncbi:MAG TPA: cysteine desulfurase family protein, partial [Myxococcota bacterium]|nr:cysteine desulfurase family protein [Myxococcota bacterium]
MRTIYLDYNASTPLDGGAAAAMQPYLTGHHANPTGNHAAGKAAAEAVESARAEVARFLDAEPEEIVFTSGATEANNWVLRGVAEAHRAEGKHIIISAVEHPSIQNPCRALQAAGLEVTTVPVDSHGRVSPEAIAAALRPDTLLVSVMHANNEIGSIQPIAAIAEHVRRAGARFHTDAALSAGKLPTRVAELGVDFLTLAAHKMYGPKGVGALFIRRGVTLEPLLRGGAQQRGLRAGTENPMLATGFAAACRVARGRLADDARHMRDLRDRLQERLCNALGPNGARVFGHPTERLPNTLSISFAGVDSRALLAQVPHIAASAGGASCSKGGMSPVLVAMGVEPEWGPGV